MKTLLTKSQQIAHFTEQEIDQVAESFEERILKKNEALSDVGEICQYLYYVKSGCIRTLYHKSNGRESTRCLAFPGMFATNIHSFLRKVPSNESIQAIMPSKILFIHRDKFDRLIREIPAWEKLYHHHLENLCFDYLKRIESFINRDARERYELLLQHNPIVVQTLPNKIVASYLGITQESLSRLKKANNFLPFVNVFQASGG